MFDCNNNYIFNVSRGRGHVGNIFRWKGTQERNIFRLKGTQERNIFRLKGTQERNILKWKGTDEEYFSVEGDT